MIFTLGVTCSKMMAKTVQKFGRDSIGLAPDALGNGHPLRMEAWVIRLQRGFFRRREDQCFSFLESGDVVMRAGDECSVDQRICGKWWFDKEGLRWDVAGSEGRGREALHAPVTAQYSAQVHLNVFGPRPRMLRGVVTRDRYSTSWIPPHVLRPVIGTFYGFGDGKDTLPRGDNDGEDTYGDGEDTVSW